MKEKWHPVSELQELRELLIDLTDGELDKIIVLLELSMAVSIVEKADSLKQVDEMIKMIARHLKITTLGLWKSQELKE